MNYRRILSQIAIITGVFLLSAGIQTFAAFSQPSEAPPNADAYAPLTTGMEAQVKVGGLLLNTGGAPNGLIIENGNVGIGTNSPAQKLDVAGYVKGTGLCIGTDCKTAWPAGGAGGIDTTVKDWARTDTPVIPGILAAQGVSTFPSNITACNAASEGLLRYNSTIKNMEFCNGSVWRHATVCASITGSSISTPSIDEDCNGVLDNKTDVYLGHLWGRDGNYCEPDGTNCTSMCQTNSGNPNSPYVHYVPGTVDLCGGAGCQADCRLITYY